MVAAGLSVASAAVAPTSASAVQDPTACQNTVALVNGGFEVPVIPNATFRLFPAAQVPGWSTTDSLGQIELWSSGFQGVPAAQGRQFAELNANSASMLFQDVATTPGQTLRWTLRHRARVGSDVMRVVIGSPGGTLVQSGPNLRDGTAWGAHSGTYTVPAGQTVTRFGFQAVSAGSGSNSVGNFLDDITFGTGPCLITTKSVTNLTRGGTTAEVGDVLRYTVTTRNDGGNAATESISADQLNTGIDFVPGSLRIISGAGSGSLTDATGDDRGEFVPGSRTVRVRLGDAGSATAGGSIGVGTSTSYTFDARVNVSAANGVIPNEADVDFRDTLIGQNRTSISNETRTPVGPAADLAITKTLDTTPLVAGEPATFTIAVRNNGPQTATSVRVDDPVPPGYTAVQATTGQGSCAVAASITCDIGSLAVGAGTVITVTGTVSPALDPGSALTNTASVAGALTDPNLANNTATASGTLTAEADLSIVKTFAPSAPIAGENVTYTLTVHNDGPSEAREVRVTDPLDPAVTFVEATPQQGTCAVAAHTLGCVLGTLAPGDTTTVSVVVRIAAGATAVVQNSASVTSVTPDPDPTDNVDSTSFNPQIIADLAVTKTASAPQVPAGGVVTYTIEVTNNGASDAVNAVLDDSLPSGLTIESIAPGPGAVCAEATPSVLQCRWDTLVRGASSSILVQARVAADAPEGIVTNTASVTSPAEDSRPDNNSDSADVEIVHSADISVVKTADARAVPGEAFGYTLTVTNAGPSVSRGVVLADTLPSGFVLGAVPPGCTAAAGTVTCSLGDLAVQQVVSVRLVGALEQSATGTLSNTATVNSPTPDPDLVNNISTVNTPLTPEADVVLLKSTSTPSVPLEGEASFLITVRNDGPSTAAGVVVEEFAPGGLIVVTATPSEGSWSAADARWTVGTLLPGASATLAVTARVLATGPIVNTATASSQTPDPDLSNNTGTATVEGTPSADVSVVKSVSLQQAQLNAPLTYTLVVSNAGPSPAVGVTVTDPLPTELISPSTPTPGCAVVGSTLQCAIDSLAVDASFTATVTGTVDPATAASSMTNTATVTAQTPDPNSSNNASTVTIPVVGTPQVELIKSASAPIDADGDGRIAPGDRIEYTFVVRNPGSVTLTGAEITDQLLGGPVPCTAFDGPLVPGASVTCAPVVYTLTQEDLDAGAVHNDAVVEAQSGRGPATDDAEADVTVPAVSSIQLTKSPSTVFDTDENGRVDPGDVVVYTFSVTNTGTTSLRDGQITDAMLGGPVICTALDGAILVAGASVTCDPVTYTLTQSDIDDGVVRNTASVLASSPSGTVEDTASASVDLERTAGITLRKDVGPIADGDGAIGAGDTVAYSFTVRNTGNTTLTDVEVSDPLLAPGVLCTIAVLPVGGDAACGPFDYTLTQDDIEDGSRANTATVTGSSPIGPVGDESSAEIHFAGTPAIELIKIAGAIDAGEDGMVGAGDSVPYTFRIRNVGTVILTAIELDDPLLGGPLVCPPLDGRELRPGDEVECGPVGYALTQADVDAGTVRNVAAVAADSVAGPVEDVDEAEIAVFGTDRISLLKSADAIDDANGSGRPDAGDTISYTFTVTNTGTTTLTAVSVADPRLTGDIVCDEIELAPGQATLCTGEPAVITREEVDAGEIVNTATATGTGTGDGPVTAEDTLTTPIDAQPAIALTKTVGGYVDVDGNGTANAGDTLMFRFTVTNTGNRTLTDVQITDAMLGGAIGCGVPDLVPGAAADCGPVRYTLSEDDVASGGVVNVATVSAAAGPLTVTASATASFDLRLLAVTGGGIAGLGVALALAFALLLGGVLGLRAFRTRRIGGSSEL